MKLGTHAQTIEVTIVDTISIDHREAAFLREMAKHCIKTRMAGSRACERLVQVLDAANVAEYDNGPVYGVFERKS